MTISVVLVLALMAYTYVGYPLLLALSAVVVSLRKRTVHSGSDAVDSVSVVICAHNEESLIGRKLQNMAGQSRLPRDCEIVVATDGARDATAKIALERAKSLFGTVSLCEGGAPWPAGSGRGREARIVVFEERKGKAALLNAVVPLCRGRIVVLADVRQEFHPGAIRTLLEVFNDPRVGAVSGELIFRDSDRECGAAEGIGFYWSLEKLMRKLESRIDSTCGCTGAIYAVRRELFPPLHSETICDDVAIPMLIAMSGKRVVFEGAAVAYDKPSDDFRREYARKVRTLAGNFQLCRLYPALLNPLKNRIWLQFVSHKLLRLLGPWLMTALLVLSSVAAVEHMWAAILVAAQVVFYCVAAIGLFMGRQRCGMAFSAPASFVMLNWAAAAALFRFLGGRLGGAWERSDGRL